MASMAAAIHAAKVRSSEKTAEKAAGKTADKTTENNAVKNSALKSGTPKNGAQKNSASKNNADRKNSSRGTSERNSNASRSNRRAGANNRARKQGNQQGDNKSSQQNRPAPRRYEPLIPEAITYPEELPVSERREDIMNAIRDNQVVIIAGETGSGKTTQIPNCASTWAWERRASSATPSRADLPHAPSPNASPKNLVRKSVKPSATRCDSPPKWANTALSSS